MNLQVANKMMDALSSLSEGAFQGAAAELSNSKEAVREELQKKTSSRIREIIKKLSNNSKISPEDIDLIESWIIGDAESYMQAENNLNDWIQEYKRLAGVLASYENRSCDEEDLFKLSGLLEDAVRISYDIANFLEKKERINKFQLATSDGLDKEERNTLLGVLNNKFRSPEF